MRPKKHPKFAADALLKSAILAAGLAVCPCGVLAQIPVSDPPANPSAANQGINEARFPVALQHSGSWCYGYLYSGPDRIRFEVVQPQSDKALAFDVPRAEVTAGQWILLGMPQDAIVLKAKGATYIMRWLANEGEVNSGKPRRWAPPNSLPVYALIAAIQNPGAALAQGSNQAGAPGPGSQASGPVSNDGDPAPNANPGAGGPGTPAQNDGLQDVPPGRLAGVYVAIAKADGPTNTQYLFYPDGFVRNGVPQEGLLSFDLKHYRPQDNRSMDWFGRYKVEGDTVKIVWQNQFSDPAHPAEIQINETSAHPAYQMSPQVFLPMCHCTGKRLSGMYRWGGPQADQYIQFYPDGTFVDHRVTDQMLIPNPFYANPRIQRGMYQIIDQTIVFSFPDGHRGAQSFLAPKVQKDNPTFDWISLGWKMLFEEGYRAKLSQGW